MERSSGGVFLTAFHSSFNVAYYCVLVAIKFSGWFCWKEISSGNDDLEWKKSWKSSPNNCYLLVFGSRPIYVLAHLIIHRYGPIILSSLSSLTYVFLCSSLSLRSYCFSKIRAYPCIVYCTLSWMGFPSTVKWQLHRMNSPSKLKVFFVPVYSTKDVCT